MKNYFYALFNQKPPESETGIDTHGELFTFSAFAKRMIKERPLEFLVPASTVLIILVSCIGLSLVHHDTSHVLSEQSLQTKHTQIISAQINAIENQLEALQSSPQSSTALKDSLSKISGELDSVQQSMVAMKDDMDTQMTALKKEVNANPNLKQYLDPKAYIPRPPIKFF